MKKINNLVADDFKVNQLIVILSEHQEDVSSMNFSLGGMVQQKYSMVTDASVKLCRFNGCRCKLA
jgi:hypothetical protein